MVLLQVLKQSCLSTHQQIDIILHIYLTNSSKYTSGIVYLFCYSHQGHKISAAHPPAAFDNNTQHRQQCSAHVNLSP